ncbi:MAG: hypothetical protein ACTSWZ_02720, partial [Candidatus Heimdallarchaeaceae archaeon]
MTNYLAIVMNKGIAIAVKKEAKSKFDAYRKLSKKYSMIYYIFSPSEYRKADVEKLAKKHGWW